MQTNRDARKLKVASLTPHFKLDSFPFLSLSLHLPPVYTHIHTHFPPSPLLPPFLLQLESHLQGNAMSLRHEAVYLGLITAVPLLMTDCVTWFHTHMHIRTPLPRLPRHTQTDSRRVSELFSHSTRILFQPKLPAASDSQIIGHTKWLLSEACPPPQSKPLASYFLK